MYIAPSDSEAIEEPKDSIEAFFSRQRELFEYSLGRAGVSAPERRSERYEKLANSTYEDLLQTRVVFGSPERVVDRIAEFQEMLGVTGITAELNPGGFLPKEAVHRSLELLTQEVMPRVQVSGSPVIARSEATRQSRSRATTLSMTRLPRCARNDIGGVKRRRPGF